MREDYLNSENNSSSKDKEFENLYINYLEENKLASHLWVEIKN